MKKTRVDTSFKNILNKKIIVTGDKGFKATWLIITLLNIGCKNIVGLGISNKNDLLFKKINPFCKYKHYDINIKNNKKMNEIFCNYKPDIIFHLAAQPLVLESYNNPLETYKTNLIGTMNILESSLNCKAKIIINITTDKIYMNKESEEGYDEDDIIDGHDPYSSSKACVEIMSKSFYNSFLKSKNISLINVRSGNVIGGGDISSNRIFTDIYYSYLSNKKLFLRNPYGIRPYQHVLDVVFAYICLASHYIENTESIFEAYNIAPNISNDISNIELAKKAFSYFDRKQDIVIKKSIFHETRILKLKNFKIKKLINYFPLYDVEKAIELTTKAYKEFDNENEFWRIINKQIGDYWNEIKKNSY